MRKLVVSMLLVFIAASLLISNFCIRTREYTVSFELLPISFDGFKIAQISDLHGRKLNDAIVKAVGKAKPDIIAVTGDLTDDESQWETVSGLMSQLVEIAPVYYVTGNHEWWDLDAEALCRALDALGVTVLRNEYRVLTIGTQSINIAGVDDPNGYADMKTPAQLAAETDSAFTVLLSHRPDSFALYASLGFELVLSGHIHGGVLRLPFVGGVFSPGMNLFPEYDGGAFTQNGAQMIVSRGFAGSSGFPRLFNRPELPVVSLRVQ